MKPENQQQPLNEGHIANRIVRVADTRGMPINSMTTVSNAPAGGTANSSGASTGSSTGTSNQSQGSKSSS